MAKVVKGNRELDVLDTLVPRYLEEGYDQIDENGKVIKSAKKKTITVEDHDKKIVEATTKLTAEVEKLTTERDETVQEVEELKKKVIALETEKTKLTAEVEKLTKKDK